MTVIQAARELGRTIQNDERYTAYINAKAANDGDTELQNLIGEFNLLRQKLNMEISRPENEKNQEKIEALNTQFRTTYEIVMSNPSMAAFTEAKREFDMLINETNQIISLCCNGEDPDTCETVNCGGACGTCGGRC